MTRPRMILAAFAGSTLLLALSSASTTGGEAVLARPLSLSSVAAPIAAHSCSRGVIDFHDTSDCITASRTPSLGSLYPLSDQFFVSPDGNVGIGTTHPTTTLEVVGKLSVTEPAGVPMATVRPSASGEFGVIETFSTFFERTSLTSTVGIDPDAGAIATFRGNTLLASLTTPNNDSNSGFVSVRNNNVEIAGINGSTGIVFGTSKSFVQPHPYDSTKEIRYVSLEGPEHGVYFRGTARLSEGSAVIAAPESFRLVARDEKLTVSLTPLGPSRGLYVASKGAAGIEVRENEGGSGDVEFDYLVMGERSALPQHAPIVANTHFAPEPGATIPDERLPGTYRALMIQNGTLDADGRVNEANALTLGWRNEDGRWIGREHEAANLAEQPEAASGR